MHNLREFPCNPPPHPRFNVAFSGRKNIGKQIQVKSLFHKKRISAYNIEKGGKGGFRLIWPIGPIIISLIVANVILAEFERQIVKHFRTNKILQMDLLSTESLLLLVIGHLCHIPSFPPWKIACIRALVNHAHKICCQ